MKVTVPLVKKSVLVLFFILISVFTVQAQYFGQNKVRYKNLKFKVLVKFGITYIPILRL